MGVTSGPGSGGGGDGDTDNGNELSAEGSVTMDQMVDLISPHHSGELDELLRSSGELELENRQPEEPVEGEGEDLPALVRNSIR